MTLRGAGGSGGGGGPNNHRDSLFSEDSFEFVLGVSEGEIGGVYGSTTTEKLQNIFINDTPLLDSSGASNFDQSDLVIRYEPGSSLTAVQDPFVGQTPIRYVLGGSTINKPVNIALNSGAAVSKITPVIPTGFDEIDFRFSIPRLAKYTDEGVHRHELELQIRYREVGSATWTYLGNSGKSETAVRYKISGKTTVGGYVKTVKAVVAKQPNKAYELEVKKLSGDSTQNYSTDIGWIGFELTTKSGDCYTNHEVEYTDPTLEYHPGTAMLHVSGVLGQEMNQLPNISAVWSGILCSVPSNYNPETKTYSEASSWNGEFKLKKAVTDNPFWIAHELITNPVFGLARYNPRIRVNRYSVYEKAKYADGYNPLTNQKDLTNPYTGETQAARYTFNGVLDSPSDGLEAINYILASAFARAVDNEEGEILLVADMPSVPVVTITEEMCIQHGPQKVFSYSYSDITSRHNAITSSYIDPDFEWRPQMLGEVRDDEAISRHGLNPFEFEAVGCLSAWECWRKMYFYLMTSQTEITTVSFVMPMSGIGLELFDVISICDPALGYAASGRAVAYQASTKQIMVRDAIYFAEAGLYHVEVHGNDSVFNLMTTIQSNQVGMPVTVLTLAGATPAESELPTYPVVVVKNSGSQSIGLPKPFRVLGITEVDNEPQQRQIVAVEVNANKHGAADQMMYRDVPQYSWKKQIKATPVKNVAVVKEERVRVGNQITTSLWVAWEPGTSASFGISYEVSYSVTGTNSKAQTLVTSGTLVEIPNLGFGEVSIRVTTVYNGQRSVATAILWQISQVGIGELLEDLAGLRFEVSTETQGKNVVVNAVAQYDFGGERGVVNLQDTEGFNGVRLTIYDNSNPQDPRLLRVVSELSKDISPEAPLDNHKYEYSRSQNRDDNNGAMATQLFIFAELVDRFGIVHQDLSKTLLVSFETELLALTGLVAERSDNLPNSGGLFTWTDPNPVEKVVSYSIRMYRDSGIAGGDELITSTAQPSSQDKVFTFPRVVAGAYYFQITALGPDGEISPTGVCHYAVGVPDANGQAMVIILPGSITVELPELESADSYYQWRYGTQDFFAASLQGGTGRTIRLAPTVEGQTYYFWYRVVSPEGVSNAWHKVVAVGKGLSSDYLAEDFWENLEIPDIDTSGLEKEIEDLLEDNIKNVIDRAQTIVAEAKQRVTNDNFRQITQEHETILKDPTTGIEAVNYRINQVALGPNGEAISMEALALRVLDETTGLSAVLNEVREVQLDADNNASAIEAVEGIVIHPTTGLDATWRRANEAYSYADGNAYSIGLLQNSVHSLDQDLSVTSQLALSAKQKADGNASAISSLSSDVNWAGNTAWSALQLASSVDSDMDEVKAVALLTVQANGQVAQIKVGATPQGGLVRFKAKDFVWVDPSDNPVSYWDTGRGTFAFVGDIYAKKANFSMGLGVKYRGAYLHIGNDPSYSSPVDAALIGYLPSGGGAQAYMKINPSGIQFYSQSLSSTNSGVTFSNGANLQKTTWMETAQVSGILFAGSIYATGSGANSSRTTFFGNNVSVAYNLTVQGTISNFTASHPIVVSNEEVMEEGDLLVRGQLISATINETLFFGSRATQVEQRGVIGAFSRVVEVFDDQRIVLANAGGEGTMNVCGRGGLVLRRDDLLVASDLPGKAQKQSDHIPRAWTVAKVAQDEVTFSNPDEVKSLAVVYLCG